MCSRALLTREQQLRNVWDDEIAQMGVAAAALQKYTLRTLGKGREREF
jgi:hypothetical protein